MGIEEENCSLTRAAERETRAVRPSFQYGWPTHLLQFKLQAVMK
jgi:hypothetical protein